MGWLSLHDHAQRGLRTGLGMLVCMLVGFCGVTPHLASSYHRGLVESAARAAGITCVVVAAPVLGKVCQVGLDRAFGTLLGGAWGFGAYALSRWVFGDDEFAAFLSLAVVGLFSAWLAVILGWEVAKLETTPRLFSLTFLLVAFGAHTVSKDLDVMVARIVGILGGCAVSLTIACLVYPKSATHEALAAFQAALGLLARLNKLAWEECAKQRDGKRESPVTPAARRRDQSFNAATTALLLERPEADEERGPPGSGRRETEDALMELLAALQRCRENVPLARSEVYVGEACGKMWLLPGLPYFQRGSPCSRHHLPEAALTEARKAVRKTAWLLWALQEAFRQAPDSGLLPLLEQHAVAGLVAELRATSGAAVSEMAAAFPSYEALGHSHSHIAGFRRAVGYLVHGTGAQRRPLLAHMRSSSLMRRSSSAARPGGTPRGAHPLGPEAAAGGPRRSAPVLPYFGPRGALQRGGERADSLKGSAGSLQHWAAAEPSPRGDSSNGSRSHRPSLDSFAGFPPGPASEEGSHHPPAPPDPVPPGVTAQQVVAAGLTFGEDMQGQVSEVQWGSFQLLMEELGDALCALGDALETLAHALPCRGSGLGAGKNPGPHTPERDLY